ncbi:MAG: hypothetical protein LKF34_05070 [Acidaminococcaceae bacterium]|jgi:uncharacterized protein YcfJ|nr:hypothetical protein [Acidaminococcaceae bacterium]
MAANKEKLAADLIAQISKDPALMSKFQSDPMGTAKELAGTDLGADVLGLVGEEFGVNLGGAAAANTDAAASDAATDAADTGSAASGLMGMVGKILGGNK